jgi:hypothetical protein
MSKRHFIALADYAREVGLTEGQIRLLADLLQSENPRFNRERWLGYIAGTNGPSGGTVKPSVRKQTRVHADDEGSF